LQSQINPHFLFNTINTISTLADIEDAPRTKKVLESMSDILRYNFKKLEENVTLKEEYRIIKNYLHIQKVRFGERIQFIINVDKSSRNCMIPSMIIQPFVENAIVHGLEPKLGNGILELSISSSEEQLKILIKDNGLGMEEEKIKGFFASADASEEKSHSGIGVRNVIRRLELIYGRNVVEIQSQLGEGTEVRISIPNNLN
jgi:sensor histidine kinase YesM